MRTLLLCTFILLLPLLASAKPNYSFGSCFSQSNKKSIDKKMDKLLDKVSRETNCPKEQLKFEVTDYYTGFYSKECRHLPKKITFEAAGEKRTYHHSGISGAALDWLMGSWKLQK